MGSATWGEGRESGLLRGRGWAPVLPQQRPKPSLGKLWSGDGPSEVSALRRGAGLWYPPHSGASHSGKGWDLAPGSSLLQSAIAREGLVVS